MRFSTILMVFWLIFCGLISWQTCAANLLSEACDLLFGEDAEYNNEAAPIACFKMLGGSSREFSEAIIACNDFATDAHLAFVMNATMQNFLAGLVDRKVAFTGICLIKQSSAWLGGKRISSEWWWTKDGNSKTSLVPISQLRHRLNNDDKCIKMLHNDDGKLDVHGCSDDREYAMCQIDVINVCMLKVCLNGGTCVQNTSSPELFTCECLPQYTGAHSVYADRCTALFGVGTEYNNQAAPLSCFKILGRSNRKFGEAINACLKKVTNSSTQTAHLAFVMNSTMQTFLADLVDGVDEDSWVGGKRINDNWCWTADGSNKVSFVSLGQLNHDLNTDNKCIKMRKFRQGQLDEKNCGDDLQYAVCQIDVADICMSDVCLNGGTCVKNSQSDVFSCSCLPLFSGQYCESCNTEWSSWNACSVSCDYGFRYRTQFSCNANAGLNYEYQGCRGTPCRTYDYDDFAVCQDRGGFYTNNACYFAIRTTDAISWPRF